MVEGFVRPELYSLRSNPLVQVDRTALNMSTLAVQKHFLFCEPFYFDKKMTELKLWCLKKNSGPTNTLYFFGGKRVLFFNRNGLCSSYYSKIKCKKLTVFQTQKIGRLWRNSRFDAISYSGGIFFAKFQIRSVRNFHGIPASVTLLQSHQIFAGIIFDGLMDTPTSTCIQHCFPSAGMDGKMTNLTVSSLTVCSGVSDVPEQYSLAFTFFILSFFT